MNANLNLPKFDAIYVFEGMIDRRTIIPEHELCGAEYFPDALIALLRSGHRGETVMVSLNVSKL